MTPDKLAAIWSRCNSPHLSPGPWNVVGPPWNTSTPYVIAGGPDPHIGTFVADLEDLSDYDEPDAEELRRQDADAEFIAHARADVPALLDLVDELQRQLADRSPES